MVPPCRWARTPSAADGTPLPSSVPHPTRTLTRLAGPYDDRPTTAFTPRRIRRVLSPTPWRVCEPPPPTPLARSAARVAYGGAPVRGGDFPQKHRRHKAVGGFAVCSAVASHIPPIGGGERGIPPTAVGGWDSPTIGDCGRKAENGHSAQAARVGFLCSCQGHSRRRR